MNIHHHKVLHVLHFCKLLNLCHWVVFSSVHVSPTGANWFHSDELDMDGTATMIPRREPLQGVKVHQIEKDAIIICHGHSLQIVTMNGVLRQSKKMVAQLHFEFPIESIGMSSAALHRGFRVVIVTVCSHIPNTCT